MADRFLAAIDGGSRGNPGPAAWGVAVLDDAGACVEGHSGSIGHATNNVAEYRALLEALDLAARRGAGRVEIRSDSELLVRQIQGRYRVRHPALQPLHAEAQRRIGAFGAFRIAHVRREENKDADRLVNQALDRACANAGESAAS
jgi:ribonuclease HI